MSADIRPLADRLLIRPRQPEAKTAGGILLAAPTQSEIRFGEVLEVGPTVTKDSIKKGDVVVYNNYRSTDLSFQGEELVLLDESDCIAVVSR